MGKGANLPPPVHRRTTDTLSSLSDANLPVAQRGLSLFPSEIRSKE